MPRTLCPLPCFSAERDDTRRLATSAFYKAIACPQIHDMDPDMRSIPGHLAQLLRLAGNPAGLVWFAR
jgi:hypothetical protein